MMFKLLYKIPLLLIILFPDLSKAQNWELGGWLGTSHYLGDLNTNYDLTYVRPAGGVYGGRNFNPHFAAYVNFNYGWVGYNDSRSSYPYQKARNLSFYTHIFELSGRVHFNFFPYEMGDDEHYYTPYLFIGAGLFHFRPKTRYNNDRYVLPLEQTEGVKYSGIQPVVPVGGGFKFALNHFWSLGIEAGYRKTFTDYLDDVSTTYPDPASASDVTDRSDDSNNIGREDQQRGNSQDKDRYIFIGINLSYTFPELQCPKPIQ